MLLAKLMVGWELLGCTGGLADVILLVECVGLETLSLCLWEREGCRILGSWGHHLSLMTIKTRPNSLSSLSRTIL